MFFLPFKYNGSETDNPALNHPVMGVNLKRCHFFPNINPQLPDRIANWGINSGGGTRYVSPRTDASIARHPQFGHIGFSGDDDQQGHIINPTNSTIGLSYPFTMMMIGSGFGTSAARFYIGQANATNRYVGVGLGKTTCFFDFRNNANNFNQTGWVNINENDSVNQREWDCVIGVARSSNSFELWRNGKLIGTSNLQCNSIGWSPNRTDYGGLPDVDVTGQFGPAAVRARHLFGAYWEGGLSANDIQRYGTVEGVLYDWLGLKRPPSYRLISVNDFVPTSIAYKITMII